MNFVGFQRVKDLLLRFPNPSSFLKEFSMNRRLLSLLSVRSSRLILFGLIVFAVIFTNLPNAIVHAAAGDLDPTFGNGGKVVIPTHGLIYDMAIQQDGKLVAAGYSTNGFSLIRCNSDGSLDTTFGNGGFAINDFSLPVLSLPTQIVLQPDGKILLGGWGGASGITIGFALARYNTDGTLDQTFGTHGKVVTSFGGFQDEIWGLAVQPDGKIVASGRAGFPGAGFLFAVARYNSDGSLDTSFGTGGKFTHNFSDPRAYDVAIQSASEVAIQKDGKIVVTGTTLAYPTFYDFVTVRLNPDGTFDNSFASQGWVLTDFAYNTDNANTIILQPDGKILVGGSTFYNSSQSDFALVRFNTDGTLDPSFGTNGKVHTDFAGYYDVAYSLALQNDGRIVLAGKSYIPATGYDFAIARFNTDGSLDPHFGNGGKVQTDFFGKWDQVASVAVQSDGRIVAGGLASSYAIDAGDFALARYDANTFDLCIQDDSSGSLLQINTTSGEYQFSNCGGLTIGGTGTLTKRGSAITLQHTSSDRRVMATIDSATNRATASLQLFSQGRTFSITDRNITNNTCACR
jgi:uncharacterized delta-60 repeat protein